MKLKLSGCLLAVVLFVCPSSLSAGSIFMSSTGYPDSVAIDVNISDDGLMPSCPYLGIVRTSDLSIVAVIARQPGTTITRHVVDANVEPNTIYCYRMALLQLPWPVPAWCGGNIGTLCGPFDCFYDFQACSNTGPDPAFIGHGFLTSEGAIPNETAAFIVPCDSGAPPIPLYSLSGTASPYLDSGITVDVFGTMERGGIPQGVWYYVAQAATPHSCVLAVEPTSWGAVKALYRE